MRKFPFFKQLDAMDCGPTCLQMISQYYGKFYSLSFLKEKSYISREGVSLLGLSEAATSLGYATTGAQVTFEQLEFIHLPCIAHLNGNHFVVIIEKDEKQIYVADPRSGLHRQEHDNFLRGWALGDGKQEGIVLILEPTDEFYERAHQQVFSARAFFLNLFKKFSTSAWILAVIWLCHLTLQVSIPLSVLKLIDSGMSWSREGLLFYSGLMLMLMCLNALVKSLRSNQQSILQLKIAASMDANFLERLLRFPQSFFSSKVAGDILERINDHSQIGRYLSKTGVNLIFSMTSLIVLAGVLAFFNVLIAGIVLGSSAAYFLWIKLASGRERAYEHARLLIQSESQNLTWQMVSGIQDIRLSGAEKNIMERMLELQNAVILASSKSERALQRRVNGAMFILDAKDYLIVVLCMALITQSSFSVGMMITTIIILHQINQHLITIDGLLRSNQNIRSSIARIEEVNSVSVKTGGNEKIIEQHQTISFHNVSFCYEGPNSPVILKEINLMIPAKKVTAIVGPSGGGKTTILKLILDLYQPTAGEIRYGSLNLSQIQPESWSKMCSAVMQDSYIFNDTIVHNISLADSKPDWPKVFHATKIAQLDEFVQSLPLGFQTKVGYMGLGLSMGQKQRLLIARAVYKDAPIIVFDEATNALDATTEKNIVIDLERYYHDKTVIIIAHRLSTVMKADNIVVLEHGSVVESGTHSELLALKGSYYRLVKNQLSVE